MQLNFLISLLIFGPLTKSESSNAIFEVKADLPALPPASLPINPMAVTSSSFELLPDKIGFKLAINYACGVTLAMSSFLNESLLSNLPSSPIGGGALPIVGGKTMRGDSAPEQVVKYINPIVLVGHTCIQVGSICGNYNVNKNSMSVS